MTWADPCTYAHHRRHDWLRRDVGLVTCGACHPPAGVPDELLVHRGDPDFEQLAERTAGGWVRKMIIEPAVPLIPVPDV